MDIQDLDPSCCAILMATREEFVGNGRIMKKVVGVDARGDLIGLCFVDAGGRDGEQAAVLTSAALLVQRGATAVALVTEAWTVLLEPHEAEGYRGPAPSQHPRRRDAVVVTYSTEAGDTTAMALVDGMAGELLRLGAWEIGFAPAEKAAGNLANLWRKGAEFAKIAPQEE